MTKKISKRQENLLKMIDKTKDDKDYQKIWERKLEELYWWRVEKLFTMYSSITNDLVYKAMWERKLKELLLRGFRGE